jgi:adenylate cyclase
VEALTKELGRPILVSEPVAHLLERELENMGSHQLRGFSGSVALYAVPVPATGRQ